MKRQYPPGWGFSLVFLLAGAAWAVAGLAIMLAIVGPAKAAPLPDPCAVWCFTTLDNANVVFNMPEDAPPQPKAPALTAPRSPLAEHPAPHLSPARPAPVPALICTHGTDYAYPLRTVCRPAPADDPQTNPVPLPASLWLLLAGLGLITAGRVRA